MNTIWEVWTKHPGGRAKRHYYAPFGNAKSEQRAREKFARLTTLDEGAAGDAYEVQLLYNGDLVELYQK